ncbi:hypothetical protein Trco_007172 [Trichoderma cornu-damae]|uniref:Secreted protein n=1 Tax=Trichoderma cornu-damae TaxID=654480 RepID=A0A9P8QG60_9HYPO|nr:hypothetical protein Trco_007172 [Trichoderma cornu-damae]
MFYMSFFRVLGGILIYPAAAGFGMSSSSDSRLSSSRKLSSSSSLSRVRQSPWVERKSTCSLVSWRLGATAKSRLVAVEYDVMRITRPVYMAPKVSIVLFWRSGLVQLAFDW